MDCHFSTNPVGHLDIKLQCLDSWENLAKVNIAGEENAVLFTGYLPEAVTRLSTNPSKYAVLECACSSTVCGKCGPRTVKLNIFN